MNKFCTFFLTGALAFAALAAEARLYRWVDEQGNVQYSDKPPPSNAKGLTELDQRGMVRKAPTKAASAGEIAQREADKQKQLEQKRRDSALLQSFSRPEEIDFLRNRQIDAVRARLQTNKLLQQSDADKLSRFDAQAAALTAAGKPAPETLKANQEAIRKELSILEGEARKMEEEIQVINARAEADKRRLIELQGVGRR